MTTSIEDLTARAKTLIAERRYQEAVRACRRVLLSRPAMTEVRILLGMALLALKRHDEVRAEMMAVLRQAPDDARAHRLLGEAHLRDGQMDKAQESLGRALELNPTDDESRDLLAELDGEDPIPPGTIDRWFDPEAVATQQMDAPAWTEDETGTLSREQMNVLLDSIEARERHSGRVPALEDIPGEETVARPPAPRSAPPPPPAPSSSRDKKSSFPPPPSSTAPTPGSAGAPKRPMWTTPAVPPVLPPVSNAPFESDTAAHTPFSKGALDDAPYTRQLASPRSAPPPPPPYSAPPPPYMEPPVDPYYGHEHAPPMMNDGYDQPPFAPHDYDQGPAYPPQDGYQEQPHFETVENDVTWAAHPIHSHDDELDNAKTAFRPALREEVDYLGDERTVARSMPSAHPPALENWGLGYEGSASLDAPLPAPGSLPSAGTGRGPRAVTKKRSRLPLVFVGVLFAGLLIGGIVVGIIKLVGGPDIAELRATVDQACADGLESSLEAALRKVGDHDDEDPEIAALEARILATLTLEHGGEHAARIEALLATLRGADLVQPDAVVAKTYLELSRGDVDGAHAALTTVSGDADAELFRARALVAAAQDDVPRALAAAASAVTEYPTSPRHVSLHALLTARSGDVQAALTALDGLPSGDASPAVRVARARIVKNANSDPERAETEASTVIDDLSEAASRSDLGWAHLVRAWYAVTRGDSARGLSEARAAQEQSPTGDEAFGLELAEIFLDAGSAAGAEDVIAALPERSGDPQKRARIRARVALERGDADAAAAALSEAGDSPHAAFLRGRVSEMRGRLDEAKEHYQRAMATDQSLRIPSRVRLGAIAVRQNRAADAVQQLEPAFEVSQGDREVVPMLIDALLSLGRADRAQEVIQTALSVPRPEGVEPASELLAARAKVDLARGDIRGALDALRGVAENRPDDPDVHVARANAARLAGEDEEAKTAYERALELRAGFGDALAGLALLAVATGDLEAADSAIQRAVDAGAATDELEQARARLMVVKGMGKTAIAALTAAAERSHDATIFVALGEAQFQAEEDRGAERSFDQALRLDGDNPEAHLGLARIKTRAGSITRAERHAEQAEAQGRERGLGDSFRGRVLAVRGRMAFELGNFARATERANEAIRLDDKTAEAHLLRAVIAIETNDDPIPHLRLALEGRSPTPEAVGRLAILLGSGEEACALAARYLESAPEGYDAPEVRRIVRRCR